MNERMFGMETEYGLAAMPTDAECSMEHLAEELVNLARQWPHLPGDGSRGVFLANGSRFYVDCGAHPELATPECVNPWDVCRYVLAGERILLDLAGQLPRRIRGLESVSILRTNTDYLTGATWGCHESYLHKDINCDSLARQLIPHLATRLVFCGVGGFNCFSPGVAFLLSPRVAHLQAAVSNDSTCHRGIFHTRNQSLCGNGYKRLHNLCGESLNSQIATWLKIGTTAIVIAMIEAGKRPGDAMDFPDPLAAMRLFAADPSCQVSVRLANGREVTILDVQFHYLHYAEKFADAAFMPPWAAEIIGAWRDVLDRLRMGGPVSMATTLDWAIKHELFKRHLERRGLTFETLAKWNHVLEQLTLANSNRSDRPLKTAVVLASRGSLAIARRQLNPFLREHGLSWDGLDAVLATRLELFEIDTRFSILGDKGIFTSLDRSGVLDHRVKGVDNIPYAAENPPAKGRAALRGACIKRFAGQKGRYTCEWEAIVDRRGGQWLNLNDPFCESEQWEKIEEREENNSSLEGLFRFGRYADVVSHFPFSSRSLASNFECISLSYARLGRLSEALEILQSQRSQLSDFHHLCLQMSVLSNGLVPNMEQLGPLVDAGEAMRERSDSTEDYSRFIYLLYKGLFLMHSGLHPLAEAVFTALLDDRGNAFRSRMYGRTKIYFSELQRQLGRPEAALRWASEAHLAYEEGHLIGDIADHSLPMLAKLSTDDSLVGQYFAEAETIERQHHNNLGLARILCLRARRLHFAGDKQEIEVLLLTIPALVKCKVARRILREWRNWIAPQKPADEPMDYWGL
jgi:tetratricopeptide (TPR) repeat protein